MKKLILASGSPRRRELLTQIGLEYECIVSDADESFECTWAPDKIVMEIALKKAQTVAASIQLTDSVVLGADTIVVLNGAVLGKPENKGDAVRMLGMLSGREHLVYTGIALVSTEKTVTEAVETTVKFRELTRQEIEAYVHSGEPMDKAGAYGIQGLGSSLVEGIVGDFFNVMGLPVCRTCMLLDQHFGIKTIG